MMNKRNLLRATALAVSSLLLAGTEIGRAHV